MAKGTITISGEAEAQALVGATTATGTFTVGVDDTGHDVKFFGATSGKSLLWDESADELLLAGTMKIKEQAAADADTAAYGQIWVDDAVPNALYFTNDAGNDIALTSGSAIAASSGGGLVHLVTANLPTDAGTTGTTFNNFYDSSYTSYHVVMRDVEMANDGISFRMLFNKTSDQSEEGGANYWMAINGYKHTGAVYNASSVDLAYGVLIPNLGNATGEVGNLMLTISGMQNSAVFAGVFGSLSWHHNTSTLIAGSLAMQYHGNAGTSFSGFTLKTESGNFAGGSVSIYGHATS